MRRSLTLAAIVGPVLTCVNQPEAIFGSQSLNVGKALLTLMVPFLVSCFSGVMAGRQAKVNAASRERRLATDLSPVVAIVEEVRSNALNVNSTARARFDETQRLLGNARQTVQDIEGGAAFVQEALEATATVQLQFGAVIETEGQVRDEIRQSTSRAAAVSAAVNLARTQLAEISGLAHDIGRLGHQTTLLSLNAAVAAATAGAEGKRFAAIAESVRELARESEAQAKKIHATTRELDKSASEMAAESDRLGEGMARLLARSEDSKAALALAADAMNRSIGPTKASLDMLAKQSVQIRDIAQGIGRVVDHAGAAIDGSARNAGLAQDVVGRLKGLVEMPAAALRTEQS